MREIFSVTPKIDFLGTRYVWLGISSLLILASCFLWFHAGDEKYGIDFKGGTELIVDFKQSVGADAIRRAFAGAGLGEANVQSFDSKGDKFSFSIKLSQLEQTAEFKGKLESALKEVSQGAYEIAKQEFVGPVIGEQIRRDAIYALLFSLIAMLIYVAVRFEWRYGMGAIVALFHDVIIATGLCLLTGRQFNAGILAAMLTIVGYSINDTIIIFDRVRENLARLNQRSRGVKGLVEVMNLSVNETLGRTILTSLTAFFVVTTLYLFGGGAVEDMSFALMVGIVVGTYSSVFIACPIVLALQKDK